MTAAIGAERWAAARALYEEDERTHQMIAIAMDVHVGTVRKRAARDSWIRPVPIETRQAQALSKAREKWGRAELPWNEEGSTALPPAEADEQRIAEAREALSAVGEGNSTPFLQKQFEAITLEAAATGRLPDKQKIDSLIGMARLAKELKALPQEGADDQKDGDAELGDRLRRIDDRIIELAEAHARWLVAKGDRGGVE